MTTATPATRPRVPAAPAPAKLTLNDVAFPAPGVLSSQDEEWAVVRVGNSWRRIRLHDYDEVFTVPGLYDLWVYDVLQCRSPAEVRTLLQDVLKHEGVDPGALTLLDLGAGNGCVAEEMLAIGFRRMIGLDLLPEAKTAAERDRPGLYSDYVCGDLCNPNESMNTLLAQHEYTALTCVAALGFGDIPPQVFTAALKQLEDQAIVAFTIRSDFMEEEADSPFGKLIRGLEADGTLGTLAQRTYVHRTDASGRPIHYTAIVARYKS